MEEAVIAQMIVYIVDQDEKGDPAPEFFGIGARRRPGGSQRIDDLGVAVLA
jgi:hypothetical protein